MQNVFFSRPLDPIEQSLDYLKKLNIRKGDLEHHKEFYSVIDLIPICYKFGSLTQESYDRIFNAIDTDSVASIIDDLFCAELITYDNAQHYLDTTLSLIDPKSVALSIKLLVSNNLLSDEIFKAIIEYPNHKHLFESIERAVSEKDLTLDRLFSIIYAKKLDELRELEVIIVGSENVCRLL